MILLTASNVIDLKVINDGDQDEISEDFELQIGYVIGDNEVTTLIEQATKRIENIAVIIKLGGKSGGYNMNSPSIERWQG